jgi:ParB family chromosome partitioning protein
MNAHIPKSIQAKPELVQISTAYGQQKEGSAVLPRNKYIVIRDDRPRSKEEAKRSERHGRHQRQFPGRQRDG